VIISPNSKPDYVVPYSLLASQVPGDSIIRVLCKRSWLDYLIRNYCQAKMWVRRRCKLLKMLTIYSTVTPGVAGSSPVRSAISLSLSLTPTFFRLRIIFRLSRVIVDIFTAGKVVACDTPELFKTALLERANPGDGTPAVI